MLHVGSEGLSRALRLLLVLQLSIEQAQTVAEQVEMKAKVVQSEVKAVTARHKKALEERECELLWKVTGASPPLPGRLGGRVTSVSHSRTVRVLISSPGAKCGIVCRKMLLLLLSRFSRVRLCATPDTAAHQAPLSLGFSRQEHWSGLPFPSRRKMQAYLDIAGALQAEGLFSEVVRSLRLDGVLGFLDCFFFFFFFACGLLIPQPGLEPAPLQG